jgi:hypothetical protein
MQADFSLERETPVPGCTRGPFAIYKAQLVLPCSRHFHQEKRKRKDEKKPESFPPFPGRSIFLTMDSTLAVSVRAGIISGLTNNGRPRGSHCGARPFFHSNQTGHSYFYMAKKRQHIPLRMNEHHQHPVIRSIVP